GAGRSLEHQARRGAERVANGGEERIDREGLHARRRTLDRSSRSGYPREPAADRRRGSNLGDLANEKAAYAGRVRKSFFVIVAAALIGCEATVAPPAPAPPPAPVEPPRVILDGDVPFKGTYTKIAKLSYKDGRRLKPPNTDGESTLRIEP